jgi:hypothetical protein
MEPLVPLIIPLIPPLSHLPQLTHYKQLIQRYNLSYHSVPGLTRTLPLSAHYALNLFYTRNLLLLYFVPNALGDQF